MPILEIVGWIGSAILVWSLLQTRILRLRLINLVGCLILIAYNSISGVWPMTGLNVVLAAINIYYLRKLMGERHSTASYDVVEVRPDDAYLQHLLGQHAADIATFNPAAAGRPVTEAREAYLIVHGDETVGYVLAHDAGDGEVQVDLDYVVERYRDFTPGEFVFRSSQLFAAKGYRRIVTAPGSASAPGAYYEKIGFSREGDRFALAITA
ncbi:hypothetical protein GCM10011331_12190 [Flavimobilis marinus]|uniref:Inner membrane protein n=1 Tax=Flavimobilis marinus TaxID=285351 RepID=A0A1I2HWW7_9MICO|nr:hypothetical protein [Flavimobilis marinus]GHG49538.1 hypothetical protein GCM10011331_12190 [Flavimobilis marinus]SFF34519.1 hypothetical protein SAMN04488035_2608 [Flavimobilis marinus]